MAAHGIPPRAGSVVTPEKLLRFLTADRLSVRLGRMFTRGGHELYLVGGTVRDAFMHRDVDGDLDYATDARPDETKRIVGEWADAVFATGETHGTIAGVKNGETFEITTFREDTYRGNSRRPAVAFSDAIENDLRRRDFTVNAVAVRIPDGQVVDPFGGIGDLESGVLRTPASPKGAFREDPLRMLRLFRFWATLGFRPAGSALQAVAETRERLGVVSAERIRDEFSRLLVAPGPSEALMGMVNTGLAGLFLPEVAALRMEQHPRYRHKDVLAHTMKVVDKASPVLVLRLASLLHDIGKPVTRRYGSGGASFHRHEQVGAEMTRRRLKALRYPTATVNDVSRLVLLHMRPQGLDAGSSDAAVRRYVRDAGPLLGHLNELSRCDITTKHRHVADGYLRQRARLENRIVELRERDNLDSFTPPLDGHQVMSCLGIPPGPTVGKVLKVLLDRRIEHGPCSPEGATRVVRDWAVERGWEVSGRSPPEGGGSADGGGPPGFNPRAE